MNKKIKLLAILVTFLMACEPLEVDVKEVFSFDVTSSHKSINFVSEATETEITILPERKIGETEYLMSYKVLKGKGYFKVGDKILSETQNYKVTDFSTLDYIGESVADHKIELTVTDNNGQSVSHLLNYKIIEKTDFIFEARVNRESVFFAETIEVFFDIKQAKNELNEDINYELSFVQSNARGVLYKEDETISFLEPIDVTSGAFETKFRAFETGAYTLKFSVEASNGFKHTQTVTFNVKRTEFNFTVTPEESRDYVNDKTVFHFNIEQGGIEDLNYSMRFSGQKGNFEFNEHTYVTGEKIENLKAGNFGMTYTANEITEEDIEIVITASNGISKTVAVEYKSLATNFEVLINPDDFESLYFFNNAFFQVTIIKPNVDDYDITYNMHYRLSVPKRSANFEFSNDKVTRNPDNTYSFNTETYSTATIGLAGTVRPAEGQITLVFTDSNGISFEKTIRMYWHELRPGID